MNDVSDPATKPILDEWYRAVTDCFLYGGMHEMEGHVKESKTARDGLYVLIQFGVRSKLITPAEGNDWLAALSGKEAWGVVLMKWQEEPAEAEEGAPDGK